MLMEHYGINPDWFDITTNQKWESIENEQFATVEEDGFLFIFFEKTVGGIDWLSNLNFFPPKKESIIPSKAYPEMSKPWYCHPGFAKAWRKLEKEILYRVNNYLTKDKNMGRVTIQGYSRGAALAQLCQEAILWNIERARTKTIAFAPPRWVFRWGKENVQDRLQGVSLVMDAGDLVTHTPPWWTGYVHVGNKVVISKRDNLLATPMEHTELNYRQKLKEYVDENKKS